MKTALTLEEQDSLLKRQRIALRYRDEGLEYLRRGKLPEALVEFRRSRAALPLPETVCQAGICAARLGLYDEAYVNLRVYRELNPDHAETQVWFGLIAKEKAIRDIGIITMAARAFSPGREKAVEQAEKFRKRWGRKIKDIVVSLVKDGPVPAGKKQVLFPVFWPVGLGDLVVIQQLIREYRRNHPDDYLICAIPGKERPELEELSRCNPDIDELWPVTGWEGGYLSVRDTLEIVDSHGCSPVAWQEAVLLEALKRRKVKAIFKYRSFPILLPYADISGVVDFWQEANGIIRKRGDMAKLIIPGEAISWAGEWYRERGISDKRLIFSIHIREDKQHEQDRRNPDFRNYLRLIDMLGRQYDCHLIRIGDPDLTPISRPFLLDTINEGLTLTQQGALIKQSHLFIGCNSGPQHFAAALGVPVVQGSHTLDYRLDREIHLPKAGKEDYICLFKRAFDKNGRELSQKDYGGDIGNVARWADTPAEEIGEAVRAMLQRKGWEDK